MGAYSLIDAHCHLESFKKHALDSLPSDILPVTSGYSHSSNMKNYKIASALGIPYSLGIAPQTVLKEGIGELDSWVSFIESATPNAIGECGLDFHWGKTAAEHELEEVVFLRMISLARKMELPLVLHSRKAETACLDVLEREGWKGGFMMHFFSGTLEEAERAVSMGGIISIVSLHSKNRKKVIADIPLAKLVVETDAPYVHRNIDGVIEAVKYISEVKGVTEEEVGRATMENARDFLKIIS
jgi:TatD DNase family protein